MSALERVANRLGRGLGRGRIELFGAACFVVSLVVTLVGGREPTREGFFIATTGAIFYALSAALARYRLDS